MKEDENKSYLLKNPNLLCTWHNLKMLLVKKGDEYLNTMCKITSGVAT